MNTKLTLSLSLVISLIIFIVLFLFFPYISTLSPPQKKYQSLLFTINDLAPNTKQYIIKNPKPKEPKIFTIDLIDEPEILPDEEIVQLKKNKIGGNGNGDASQKGTSHNAPQLPFVPRQILEVLPQNIDKNMKGLIDVELKIGTDGSVIEHKVITNTTGSQKCLLSVIIAAYKSKWEPVKIKNNNVVYWVEKTYRFN